MEEDSWTDADEDEDSVAVIAAFRQYRVEHLLTASHLNGEPVPLLELPGQTSANCGPAVEVKSLW